MNKGFPPTPSVPVQPQPIPVPMLFSGNWLITGAVGKENSFPLSTVADLSSTLVILGGQAAGTGYVLVPCTSNSNIGSTILFNGTVSANGLLQAASNPVITQYSAITLTATAPTAATPNTWHGVLTVAPLQTAQGSQCPFSQSVPFTAQAIAPLNGTYSGAFTQANFTVPGVGTSMSMSVMQGAPVLGPTLQTNTYYIPLTGTIPVTGSPCFSTGTTDNGLYSVIQGDAPMLLFTMNDGSQLTLDGGFLGDAGAGSIQNLYATVRGGNCSSASRVSLTRQ